MHFEIYTPPFYPQRCLQGDLKQLFDYNNYSKPVIKQSKIITQNKITSWTERPTEKLRQNTWVCKPALCFHNTAAWSFCFWKLSNLELCKINWIKGSFLYFHFSIMLVFELAQKLAWLLSNKKTIDWLSISYQQTWKAAALQNLMSCVTASLLW